jgi:hypothetical protein
MRDCCRPSRAVRERGRADRSSPPTAWEDGGNTVLQVRRSRWLRADTEMVCSSTPAVGRGELDRQPSHSAVDPAGHDQAGGRALSPGAAQEHCGRIGDDVLRHKAVRGRTHAVRRHDWRQTTAIAPKPVSTTVEGSGTAGGCSARRGAESGPPANWCHPSFQPGWWANWCHPSAELGPIPNRGHPSVDLERTGATRQTDLREKLGPPETGATRQLTSGERQAGATRASESVPLASPSRTNWCHPRVQRRRFGPALGFVFGRQTAAVGAGLASLRAYSAAEYPAWLILLILA